MGGGGAEGVEYFGNFLETFLKLFGIFRELVVWAVGAHKMCPEGNKMSGLPLVVEEEVRHRNGF